MSERQEKRRRYNERLCFIADFETWLATEPPMWKIFKWREWKERRPRIS